MNYNWKRLWIEGGYDSHNKVDHPYIITVYDIGVHSLNDGNLVFLVMQLASEGTLAERLKSGPLSLRETIDILSLVCPAIDYAHKQGVIHLDLKPRNILFSADSKPLVADFGLAQILEKTTGFARQACGGTPAYMPPEQYLGVQTGLYVVKLSGTKGH